MRRPRQQRLGLTLAEVLIVVAIMLVLSATLWLVLGPAFGRNKWETLIRNDLRQIALATHIYMAENDGQYPINIFSFPANVPKRTVGIPANMVAPGNDPQHAYYFFTYGHAQRNRERCHPLAERFQQEMHAIVKQTRYRKRIGKKRGRFYTAPGQFVMVDMPDDRVLGARLDGSVGWHPYWDDWEFEIASVAMSICP